MTAAAARRVEWIIVFVIVIADQVTKALVRRSLELHESIELVPELLAFTRVHNTGAAFGMFNAVDFPGKTLVLTGVATLALVGVAWYAASIPLRERLARLGVACILGGAIGNLIDRATAGYVLDFVDASWHGWHFWAFNVADAAISIGVVLMILDLVGLDAVHPILFELGPITIYSYGVLLAAAYLLGLWMAARRARNAGLDPNKVLDLGIWVIIAALIGAKALLLIVDFDQFTSSWSEFTTLLRSGGVFYGGLIAAVIVCIYQLRKHNLPLWTSGDLFAPGIALGYMVGRLGCLLAGCCYGRPTDVPWAVTFTDPIANLNVGTPLNVPLHPTQLYESAAGLIILLLLLAIERRGRAFPGRTFWLFVLFYSVSRFIIEFYRGDDRGMPLDALSTSQLISLVLFPLSLLMLWYLSRPSRPQAQETARPRKPRFA